MNIVETIFPELKVLETKLFSDERGWFCEHFNERNYKNELNTHFVQDNMSYSIKNIVRGLHFQIPPFDQAKLVSVLQGKVIDVVVDLRKYSPTYLQHYSIELSEQDHFQLFIPRGFAHGFAVLSEKAIFQYKVDNYYHPDTERGIVFNDPKLNIPWTKWIEKPILNQKDKTLSSLEEFLVNNPFEFRSTNSIL